MWLILVFAWMSHICLLFSLVHHRCSRSVGCVYGCALCSVVDEEFGVGVASRNLYLIPSCLAIVRSACVVSHLDARPCSRRCLAVVEVAINILPVAGVVEIYVLVSTGQYDVAVVSLCNSGLHICSSHHPGHLRRCHGSRPSIPVCWQIFLCM